MIIFKELRYKNFLSTGNQFTKIKLDSNPNTLIIGDNGSGKSTMLDALCFALFGKSFRRCNKPQLVNSINGADCLVEVDFKIGRNEFRVQRGLSPRVFEVYKNGKLIHQDSKAKDYQKNLEQTILKLNFKSFTQVVVLGSSSFIPFMQLTAFDRRCVIEDLLDIQIFSAMNVLLKGHIVDWKEQMQRLDIDLQICDEKLKLQKQHLNKLKTQKKEHVESKQDDIKENQDEIKALQSQIEDIQGTISSLQKRIMGQDKLQQDMDRLYVLQGKIEENTSRYKKEIAFFKDNDECPTCQQDIDKTFRERKISDKNKRISTLDGGLTDLGKQLKTAISATNQIQKVIGHIQTHESKIQNIINSISATNEYIQRLQEEIQELLDEKELDESDNERLVELEKEKEAFDDNRNALIDERQYYDIAYDLLKDSGIKTQIIKKYLPIMNKLVNKYLSDLDFFVNFRLDESFNETIKSRHRDDFTYQSFSEGEKFRIDIALLLTWREIARLKNSTNTNLLVLDEVFDSSLDASGTEEFLKLLHSLGQEVNIFVISHKSDQLLDKFNQVIRFKKKKNFSKMEIA